MTKGAFKDFAGKFYLLAPSVIAIFKFAKNLFKMMPLTFIQISSIKLL